MAGSRLLRNQASGGDGPTWDAVKSYLVAFLSTTWNATSSAEPSLEQWIQALEADYRSRLLGCCLAIDLASGALTSEDIYSVVTGLDFITGELCSQFSGRLLELGKHEKWICASRLNCIEPQHEGEGYVRVLEIGRFIRYYLKPFTGFTTRPDSVDGVLRRYVYDPEGSNLSDINVTWGSPTRRVWVLPREDYFEIRRMTNPEHPGTVFQEALGLTYSDGAGPGNRPYFIAVLYPVNESSGWKGRQPTALDTTWENDPVLYISYGKYDGWGRTQSFRNGLPLAPSDKMVRERVHFEFEGLTDQFQAHDIGLSEPVIAPSQELILEAALRRFGDTQ